MLLLLGVVLLQTISAYGKTFQTTYLRNPNDILSGIISFVIIIFFKQRLNNPEGVYYFYEHQGLYI